RHTRFSRDWSSDVCSSDLHSEVLHYVLKGVLRCYEFERVSFWTERKGNPAHYDGSSFWCSYCSSRLLNCFHSRPSFSTRSNVYGYSSVFIYIACHSICSCCFSFFQRENRSQNGGESKR